MSLEVHSNLMLAEGFYAMWKFIVDVVHEVVRSLQPDVGRDFLHVSNVFLFFEINIFLLQRNTKQNTDMIKQNAHLTISLQRGWTTAGVWIPLSFTFQKQQNMWNRNWCFKVQNNGKQNILVNNQSKLKDI